jgi:hypothetical protein
MSVVGGQLTELLIKNSSINLLQGMQASSTLAGAVTTLTDTAGGASTASVVLYDGEDIVNFGCLVGNQIVVGGGFKQFEGELKNGQEVKAVVSQLSSSVLYAHALVKVDEGILWMPLNITRGRVALVKSTYRMGRNGYLFGLTVWTIMSFFIVGGFKPDFFWIVLMFAVGGAALTAIVGYWVYRDSRHEGIYAEKIFKAMGFKNPEAVNLAPFSTTAQNGYLGGSHYVFHLRKALAAHDSLSKASSSQQPNTPQKKKSLP